MIGSGLKSLVPVLLWLAGVTTAASGQAASPVSSLRLRAGDVVRVEVKDEPALTGQFGVSAEGGVLFPLIGMIDVAGRPIQDVQADMKAAYLRELKNAVIRVTPLVRIPVLGEVRAPGLFFIDPTQTIGDVIAAAGGLTPIADRKKISLLRAGTVVVTRLDPKTPFPNLTLESGDEVIVGRRSWVSENAPILIGAATSVVAAAVTSLIVR